MPHTEIKDSEVFAVLRLDYISCILTVASTILLGKRRWEGWVLAALNSVVFCFIGWKTAQLGFIPANVFCIGIYAVNLKTWRKTEEPVAPDKLALRVRV